MNPFKSKLLSGDKIFGTEVDLADPCIAEMMAACGFDCLWIDTEHQAIDYQTVLNHIIACKAGGAASLVRIPQNEHFLAKRILEMGPDAILFPNVNSADELQRAMDACLYPPQGKRGFGPRRATGYGRIDAFDYIRDAADSFARLVQIEHVDAVNDLDRMLQVPGCDGFIVGPCDLSGSVGLLNQTHHPQVIGMIKTVIAKCRAAGKPIGVAVAYAGEEDIRFWYELGFQIVFAGADAAAIVDRAKTQVAIMKRVIAALP